MRPEIQAFCKRFLDIPAGKRYFRGGGGHFPPDLFAPIARNFVENPCHPLLFADSLHEKVWGGNALGLRYGKAAAPNARIGESFGIFADNIIAAGECAGRTLRAAIAGFPAEMLGEAASDGDYPLLVKLLDAREWLSVQVHPDDALAAELEGQPRGKTECWYILEAEPDAQIIYGFRNGVTAADVRGALAAGAMREILNVVPVRAGDFIPVSAGTVHAIGAGIVLYELQQKSDVTYRLYDWDRAGLDGCPRELHIEKGLRCADFSRNSFPRKQGQTAGGELFSNEYFALERAEIHGELTLPPAPHERLLTVVSGSCRLHISERITGGTVGHCSSFSGEFTQGTSAFIPAAAGEITLESRRGATVLLAKRTG